MAGRAENAANAEIAFRAILTPMSAHHAKLFFARNRVCHAGLVALKILHGPLMFFRSGAIAKSSQIPPPAGAGVFLP
jgi:hypothetical protein